MTDKKATSSTRASVKSQEATNSNRRSGGGGGGAIVSHGSVLLTDLPAGMKEIYSRVIRRFFPKEKRTSISDVAIMEEADGATLSVEVDSKETAQRLFKRLQNAQVAGRRWKVQYVPLTDTQSKAEACLVDCVLVPPAQRSLAERSLSTVPGFLAFVNVPKDRAELREEAQMADGEEGDHVSELLVSFADEGSALHARAVLSGRLVGNSGVRMFLQRRC